MDWFVTEMKRQCHLFLDQILLEGCDFWKHQCLTVQKLLSDDARSDGLRLQCRFLGALYNGVLVYLLKIVELFQTVKPETL